MKRIENLPLWKKISFAGAALTLLAGSLNLALNTNALGPDDLCGGLISAKQAQRTLGHTGRLADNGFATGGSAPEFHCKIEQRSALLGHDNSYLWVDGNQQLANFPFVQPRWAYPAEMSFFSGPATGAVSPSDGWILLPESCWRQPTRYDGTAVPHVRTVEVSSPGHRLESLEMARLLVEAANNAARLDGCSDQKLKAPAYITPVAEPKATKFSDTCGIEGFSLPTVAGVERSGSRERSGNFDAPVWTCDLLPREARSPSVSFAVVRDKTLVSALTQSIDHLRVQPPHGWKARGDMRTGLVTSCKGEDTYLSMHLSDTKAGWDEAASQSLFTSFISTTSRKLGCGNVTP
ncbi:hypothetical protein ACH427_15360 [Streptomyces sp. NPDC020379]|uniref:hypothetical protein n=1 Tax=Streptomyces sp. NPDC020379 TaxID=3365071 RepID=UPI00378B204C